MTSVVLPISNVGGTLTGGFIRYAGDDWDGVNLLLFQYGTLVKGATNPDGTVNPDTVTPIDITGFQPVGSLILIPREARAGLQRIASPQGYQLFADLTVAAGTARIVTASQGLFGFCPRQDLTRQIPRIPEPPFGGPPDFLRANLKIAAKLVDTATPGNLGTISRPPILVY